MDEIKKEIIGQSLSKLEPMPSVLAESVNLQKYKKIPLQKLASFGTLLSAYNYTVKKMPVNSVENLYRVVDNFGNNIKPNLLHQRKDGFGLTASYHDDANNLHNARLFKASDSSMKKHLNEGFDQSKMFMAIAMVNMERELADIKETQQYILDFLHEDKLASLRGDLLFLGDILDGYKYNIDNGTYKINAYTKVCDIEQSAKQNIVFFTERINKFLDGKKDIFFTDKSLKTALHKIQSEFSDYQLSLYLYGFASFMGVILLENFDEAYIESVINRLENCAFQYRELYTECYDKISSDTENALQTSLLKGAAKAGKALGMFVAGIPVIGKSQLDANLIKVHEIINSAAGKKSEKMLNDFTRSKDSLIENFIGSLRSLNKVYNNTEDVLFGKDYVYIKLP